MPDPRDFYSKVGSGVCVVKEGKILETYLLAEEELQKIEKISSLVSTFPKDFDIGILEFSENNRFGIFRIEDYFLIFPVRTENIAEIIRKREVINAT
ncbi:MAG: hypothetical protein NZ879_05220 [Archaeoglobaceae archaeon]|nr:hypothetical protein [Archaeoglobaceae archaeon]MDW8118367.1 hypothetical protein [Archaeoglobaceae archaeon]